MVPVHMSFDLLYQLPNQLAPFEICKYTQLYKTYAHFFYSVDVQNMYEVGFSTISFDCTQ